MKTPPGLLAAGLLFWGWQTNSMLAATALGLALEGSRLLRVRWEFSEIDLRRVWNLCTILFVGATIYAFSANDGASGLASLFVSGSAATRSDSLTKTSQSVLALIQWLPLIFFPMVVTQAYSSRDTMDMRVFSWVLRKRAATRSHAFAAPEINVTYPYLLVCLVGTSTTRAHPETFFAGLFLVLAWTLWAFRNRRFALGAWIALLALTAVLGFSAQAGLTSLQKVLQRIDSSWLSRFSRHEVDTSGNRTALGLLGRLKFSGRILLRVRPLTQPAPELLREASYNVFDSPWWFASRKKFHNVVVESDESTWLLLPDKPTRRAVRVSRYLSGGHGVLPLPSGTGQLRELPVFTMKTNDLGALRVESGPGLVDFICHYDNGLTIDSPPDQDDTKLPATEQAAIEAVASELRLGEMEPEAAIARLESYLRTHFAYAPYASRVDRRARETPLTRFLTRTRAGHCEYFASATTLILRAAKIPARYAVGFAVMERDGDGYVVRERHAHAWCLAYVNDTWRDVDTTPGSWERLEAQQASFWEPVTDLFSKLWFHFSKWRWGTTSLRPYLLLTLIPPVILIAARLLFRKRSRKPRRLPSRPPSLDLLPGSDSEFYLVQKRLADMGWERPSDQPLFRWLDQTVFPVNAAAEQLAQLAALHYRYRFDPRGLSPEERRTLRQTTLTWLEKSAR